MRKFGSLLVISLLLIAFGRCVADQYGALHTSEASCCQTACTSSEHDSDGHGTEQHNNEDNPAPCQLCQILQNDSMQIENGVELPCPVVSDFTPAFESGAWLEAWLSRMCCQLPPPDLDPDFAFPPAELSSVFRCFVAAVAPVRGPSVV